MLLTDFTYLWLIEWTVLCSLEESLIRITIIRSNIWTQCYIIDVKCINQSYCIWPENKQTDKRLMFCCMGKIISQSPDNVVKVPTLGFPGWFFWTYGSSCVQCVSNFSTWLILSLLRYLDGRRVRNWSGTKYVKIIYIFGLPQCVHPFFGFPELLRCRVRYLRKPQ